MMGFFARLCAIISYLCAQNIVVAQGRSYLWHQNQQYRCESKTCDDQRCRGTYGTEIDVDGNCCFLFLGYCSRCCKAVECQRHSDCPANEYCDAVNNCFGCDGCAVHNDPIDEICPDKCAVTQSPTPSPCVIEKVSGGWRAIRDGNAAETQVEYSSGLEITDERSRTTAWSVDVSTTVELGFELYGFSSSVSTNVGVSTNREFSSLWSRTTSYSETHTVTFDRPGTIFQWQFFIEDSCGRGTVESKSLMLSDSRAHPPCCLPGMFAEPDSPHTKACFPSEDGVTYYTCKGEAPATATLSPTTPRLTAPASNLNIAISDSTSGGSLSRGISGGSNSGDGASSSSGGGSTTVIVIVSVCAGVFLVLGIIGMFLFYNKKRSKATNNLPPELLPTTGGGVPMAPIALGTPCDKI